MIDKREVFGDPQIPKSSDYRRNRFMRYFCYDANDEGGSGPSLPMQQPFTLLLPTMDSNNEEIPDFDLNRILWYQVCFICPSQFHE
jgi:hypothetical protein